MIKEFDETYGRAETPVRMNMVVRGLSSSGDSLQQVRDKNDLRVSFSKQPDQCRKRIA